MPEDTPYSTQLTQISPSAFRWREIELLLVPRIKRYKVLDLYCGAGGASDGYYQAGFIPTGVDYVPQANYPYRFILENCVKLMQDLNFLRSFDFIHASPPCHAFLDSTGEARSYPNRIPETRKALIESGVPYTIENVPEAPLEDPKIIICGASPIFAGELRVIRHRAFEFSKHFIDPKYLPLKECLVEDVYCPANHPKIHTLKRSYSQYGKTDEWIDFVTVTGGGNCTKAAALDAFGYRGSQYLDRMIKSELNQAIPPAYTRYIGEAVKAILSLGDSTISH